MNHSELGPKGESVRAEIDEFIAHVFTGGEMNYQCCPEDGLNIDLGPIRLKFFNF